MPDHVLPMPPGAPPKALSGRTELYFATAPGDVPVIVFHHIQKTAGTALRKLIRDNLPPAERELLRVHRLADRSREELLEGYRGYWEQVEPARRARLACVMSHTANHLLPLLERPAQAITVLRDPVDRAISQYYASKVNAGKPLGRTTHPPPEFYKRAHDSSLDDIYAHFGGGGPADSAAAFRQSRFFNGQSRSLLDSHHDTTRLAYSEGPGPDADRWRERLYGLVEERYLVGVQERFEELTGRVAAHFGWPHSVPRAKVNARRPDRAAVPPGTADTVRAYNWLDDELHRRYAASTGAGAEARRA